MGLFAPPDLFCAVALAARGDADLPDGVHLRLMPSPALGFPIAPFGIYRVVPFIAEPNVLWRDRDGKVLGEPALDAAGGVLLADLSPIPAEDNSIDVAVELITDGPFEGRFTLLDRIGGRVFSERSHAPFIVGGPRVDRVRISGRGRVVGLRTWRVDLQRMLEPLLNQAPVLRLGLPVDGSRPWYAKGLGAGAALDQVKRGAALRLQRPDRPDGPFDALTPTDDLERVSAHAPAIDDQCEAMLGDIGTLPRKQRLKRTVAATLTEKQQIVDVGIADTLLVQAMDPGVGRYLGLVGTIDERSDGSQPLAYIAIGLFAFPPSAEAPDGRTLAASLGPQPAVVERIEARFAERAGATEVLAKLGERYAAGNSSALLARVPRLQARGLLAIAAAVPAADTPHLPAPVLGPSQWLDGNGRPSAAFRQEFLFPAPPLGSLVALGRFDDGAWTTRHQTIDLAPPADPKRRAVALLLGRAQPKPRTIGFQRSLASYMRRGLISDAPIPAGDIPVTYRAALADLFGRFGMAAQFDVAAPQRPRPPAPAPQVQLVLDGPDGVGGGAASPGHIDVTVVVPSVAALAAGSLDIASLEASFDAAALPPIALAPIAAGSTHTLTFRVDLPDLPVGGNGRGALNATFVDTAGTPSQAATLSIAYSDRRRPFVVPTGLGLIWTSRPGPSPEVELKLSWPGSPGTKYRVYIADEKGLALAGASRAEIAVEGGQRDRAHTLGGRQCFRLLTEPPLQAAAGRVVLSERLPRALATVQFLRVVPLTEQGREAEFDACGVVPVAVPTDRAPPPPRVHAEIEPQTRIATVTIDAQGLDLVELRASEPGLFSNPADPTAQPPEFRLKRAAGPVNSPVFAREIARGALRVSGDGADLRFTAEVVDGDALRPFVRYSYWAEIRMPPERRLARGIVEIPPAAGVGAVIPAQLADNPRPFSTASAPASVIAALPLPVPSIDDAVASTVAAAGMLHARLAAAVTPAASAKAIGPYRLRVWQQWGANPIGAATDLELDGSALDWEGADLPAADHPLPLTLRFVVIDPLGRESAMTELVAP